MNNVALWISVGVHDWTTEIVIIVGNVLEKKSDKANLPTIPGNNFGGTSSRPGYDLVLSRKPPASL